MSLADILHEFQQTPEIAKNFVVWQRHPAQPAVYGAFDPRLNPRLVDAVRARGVQQPYTHQAAAVAAALNRENVVVTTPTASGKTLCYNLPVINEVLRDPAARALYLFPTKALAQDQLAELYGLIDTLDADIKTYTYDGDTPGEVRRAVRAAGHIVITNPDMLHTGVLPHHTKWVHLFENLRYVVIDEMHTYRGVFGSHVANVLRRLQRVCRFYGSNPMFICCSATIANPRDLAERLIGAPVRFVGENGAPRGERVLAIYNPPVVNRQLGIRRGSMREVRTLATKLIGGGVQTIVFAPSRTAVEVLLTYLRESLKRGPGIAERVRGYRGGYLPLERREIEKGLRDGSVRGVVSTNALELGIDIGGLEAAVLLGYPGSVASTLQQFGRAGRRTELALAVMVLSSSPLNQFIAQHPEFVLETAPESALVDPDNYHILISHLKCAAFELPFEQGETFGAQGQQYLPLLAEADVLRLAGGRYHWMAETYPAESISLRSASIDNFVVIEGGPKPRVIGEVDRPSAQTLIHEEAIYFHGGRQFQVERLDWEEKKAFVKEVDVDYYTDAELAVDLKVLEAFEEQERPTATVAHGEVAVSYLATVFKKIKLYTHENVGWGKIHLPQEDMHTTAFWLALPPAVTLPHDPAALRRATATDVPDAAVLPATLTADPAAGARAGASLATRGLGADDGGRAGRGFITAPKDGTDALGAALAGIGTLLANVAPLYLMCDPRDIHAVTQRKSPFTNLPTVFLYESAPGGVGFAGELYRIWETLLSAALSLAAGCACADGCPSCVGPANEVGGNPKHTAIAILRAVRVPEATAVTAAGRVPRVVGPAIAVARIDGGA